MESAYKTKKVYPIINNLQISELEKRIYSNVELNVLSKHVAI